jgi:hypothetical protein
MGVGASDIDPQTVDDLRIVEQGSQLLAACGTRAEFWESFTLLKIGRSAFQSELDRLAARRKESGDAKVDPLMVQKLGQIKTQLSPLARQLREFLAKSSAGMLDGMKQDLALVFLMGSSKARQSVARWVNDPAGNQAESALKLKILSRMVDGYRRALLEARREGSPPPAQPDTTVRAMSPSSTRLKPEFIDDLRYLDRSRQVQGLPEGSPGWDLVCLMLLEREETRLIIEELVQLKSSGKPGEFAGTSARLRTKLKQLHDQHDAIALPVLTYLRSVFGVFEGRADDLALAFLVASPQGRHRAKQWLDDPELCRGEATASMNGLRTRALSYLDALKHLPQSAAR